MRPIRLELAGFGSFRDETEFDFDGIDFFALVGPTGNGKSTVIDAIGFALYGKVPRHLDSSVASSIVSLGAIEARVRLTFDVGGARYVAVRSVKLRNDKPKQEVRLERADGTIIAAQVREFTAAIESILGLPFDDFTRCVALPQGEFQRLLQEEPKQRRSVLVRLLDLGNYEALGQRARERAGALRSKHELLAQRQEQLGAAIVDEDEVVAALGALEDLIADVDAALPIDAQRAAAIADLERATTSATGHMAALSAIAVPDDANAFASELDAARAAEETAVALTETSSVDVQQLAQALADHGDRGALDRAAHAHEQLVALRVTIGQRADTIVDLERAAEHARAVLDAATAARTTADAALEDSRNANRAHALLSELHDGDECPVCRRTIDTLPDVAPPSDFDEARQAVKSARAAVDAATDVATAAARNHATAASQLATQREQEAQLVAALGELHDRPEVVRERLAAIRTAEVALGAARDRASNAAAGERTARAAVAELTGRADRLAAAYDGQRDAVAALGPPARSPDALVASWQELAEWATEQFSAQHTRAEQRHAEIRELTHVRMQRTDELRSRAELLGVAARDLGPLATGLAAEHARRRAQLDRLKELRSEAAEIASQITTVHADQHVAELLGNLLRTNAFIDWLVEEALTALVHRASALLFELSGGQYSLRKGESADFEIVDHANADATRSVRSLSGGETFQASLALALALSDQLAELAAKGAPKLEAIFLDEGFGTLDPESLDTVATTIETLGASGRMVGIVTHVRDLAQRVPVRFEITKVANRSRVERVVS